MLDTVCLWLFHWPDFKTTALCAPFSQCIQRLRKWCIPEWISIRNAELHWHHHQTLKWAASTLPLCYQWSQLVWVLTSLSFISLLWSLSSSCHALNHRWSPPYLLFSWEMLLNFRSYFTRGRVGNSSLLHSALWYNNWLCNISVGVVVCPLI